MARGLAHRIGRLERATQPDAPPEAEGVRERLLRKIDALAVRLRAVPDWREPTLEEAAKDVAAIRAYLAGRADAVPPDPHGRSLAERSAILATARAAP